jgi:hypothetical protein
MRHGRTDSASSGSLPASDGRVCSRQHLREVTRSATHGCTLVCKENLRLRKLVSWFGACTPQYNHFPNGRAVFDTATLPCEALR